MTDENKTLYGHLSSDPDAILERLTGWIEQHNYTGYDIYDGLYMARSEKVRKNPFLNQAITQFFKKCPVNLRPLLRFPETRMAKTAGLCLHAFALLATSLFSESHQEVTSQTTSYVSRCDTLFDWLLTAACKEYSGFCWNFGFPYRMMFHIPTVVITSIVARGIFAYYSLTGREEALDVLRSVCQFIIEDLHITRRSYGLCFSYTPTKPNCCYNASMLGAEVLANVFILTGDAKLKEYAQEATAFVLHHQHDDGRWNYDITDFANIVERKQVDFHQGYILESLYSVYRNTGATDRHLRESIAKGLAFYRREQFFDDGRSKWRIPKVRPIDIHNQAQGIITFSKLASFDASYLPFARTITGWTIDNMFDEKDFFHCQKHRLYTIKIPYMRWAQAWMMLALSTLRSANHVA